MGLRRFRVATVVGDAVSPETPSSALSSESDAPTEGAVFRLCKPPVWMACSADVPLEVAEVWMQKFPSWFPEKITEGDDAGPAHAKMASLTLETGPSIVKRERPSVVRSVRYALSGRPGRAQRAFRLGLALRRAHVSTAAPLALIEVRRRGLVRDSVLVMETVAGETLREFLRSETLQEPERLRLFGEIATEVAKLHAAGYRQRDLKAPNILVARGAEDAFSVGLIDLEGMSRLRSVPWRVRIRDLARLCVSFRALEREGASTSPSESDWRELLRAYLRQVGDPLPAHLTAERLERETTRWAASKERRNRRRGRPLA